MKAACFLSVLLACGDGGGAPIDAPLDMADARPPHPIVGIWEQQGLNPGMDELVTFEASGRYRREAAVGLWSIDGDSLILQIDGNEERGSFFLSGDGQTLMTQAMLPITPTTGLVGTWRGDYQVQAGVPVESTMEFRADNKVTWTEVRPAGTRSDIGDWTMVSADYVTISILIAGTTPSTIGIRLLPDLAIGSYLHVRLE